MKEFDSANSNGHKPSSRALVSLGSSGNRPIISRSGNDGSSAFSLCFMVDSDLAPPVNDGNNGHMCLQVGHTNSTIFSTTPKTGIDSFRQKSISWEDKQYRRDLISKLCKKKAK